MTALPFSEREPCPACKVPTSHLLESIDLATQHHSYSPKDASIQTQLTILAGIPSNRFQMLFCENCGLEFSSPLKAPSEEWYRLVYKILNLYPSTRWEFDFVAASLHPGDIVGEIGCGSGEFLKLCREKGIPAIGVDFSKDAIDACLSSGQEAMLVDVGSPNAGLLKAHDRNVIVAFQVLEHLDDPGSLFEMVTEWSTPEATLWVAIPSNRRPARFFKERDYLDQPPHHMTRWTEKALAAIGHSNGWHLRRVIYEPISLTTKIWWHATRTAIYQRFARQAPFKSRAAEMVLRYSTYPFALARALLVSSNMSGQTMMAEYSRK